MKYGGVISVSSAGLGRIGRDKELAQRKRQLANEKPKRRKKYIPEALNAVRATPYYEYGRNFADWWLRRLVRSTLHRGASILASVDVITAFDCVKVDLYDENEMLPDCEDAMVVVDESNLQTRPRPHLETRPARGHGIGNIKSSITIQNECCAIIVVVSSLLCVQSFTLPLNIR